MKTQKDLTKVIVRQWPDETLELVFVTDPYDTVGNYCVCWNGEHSAGDYHAVIAQTKPVQNDTAQAFLHTYMVRYDEPGSWMDKYDIAQRASPKDHRIRMDKAKKARGEA